MLYSILLTLHIVGFTLFAGITLADALAFRQFWRLWDRDPAQALLTRQVMASFPVFMRVGAIVLILAGVGMMALVNGVFGEQLWFRIKMVLVVLIVVNGILGIRLLNRLDKVTSPVVLRSRIRWFHVVQLGLLAGVFFLSAARFN
ncbi:MAG TPA: hypothetical protein VL547_07385 [Dinghuibacter sp.]|uniref:hypothetical protein n=1 Tax=Dinghuibacter sp. TaxID=2024697 RepID=UPI002CE5C982|nr:hypothetical protein [Dinghuibacter sp.]HTJ11829.1 hypothetical protein [Dinghuibacter sp.]